MKYDVYICKHLKKPKLLILQKTNSQSSIADAHLSMATFVCVCLFVLINYRFFIYSPIELKIGRQGLSMTLITNLALFIILTLNSTDHRSFYRFCHLSDRAENRDTGVFKDADDEYGDIFLQNLSIN